MRILFLGDKNAVHTRSWVKAFEETGEAELMLWSIEGDFDSRRRNGLSRQFRFITRLFDLKRTIRSWKPDIIIAYRLTSYGFIGALTGFRPLVLAAQGENEISVSNNPLKRKLLSFTLRFAVKRASLIHCWGKNMTGQVTRFSFPESNLIVRPRGIYLDKFRYEGEKQMHNPPRIIVTRMFFSLYGHECIFRALKIIMDKGYDFHTDIIGSGELESYLKELVRSLGLNERTVFHGFVDNNLLPEYLKQSDLYITMPTTEGTSASLFEAMAAQCFPVTTDIESYRNHITDGRNGFLVPSGDHKKLAEKIEAVLNDRELFGKAVRSNAEYAARHADIRENTRYFIERYKSIIR